MFLRWFLMFWLCSDHGCNKYTCSVVFDQFDGKQQKSCSLALSMDHLFHCWYWLHSGCESTFDKANTCAKATFPQYPTMLSLRLFDVRIRSYHGPPYISQETYLADLFLAFCDIRCGQPSQAGSEHFGQNKYPILASIHSPDGHAHVGRNALVEQQHVQQHCAARDPVGFANFLFLCSIPLDPTSEMGRMRSRRARFQTPSSVSCSALIELWRQGSVSSSRPTTCVPQRTHRAVCRSHRLCRRPLWVLSSESAWYVYILETCYESHFVCPTKVLS